jgi:hypothetical protein
MSPLLDATLLSAVSIAHAQNWVPIAYEDQDIRVSGRRCSMLDARYCRVSS